MPSDSHQRSGEPTSRGLRRADGDFSRETLLKVIYFKRGDTATYAVAMDSAKSIANHLTTLDGTAKLTLQYKVSDTSDDILGAFGEH